MSVIHAFVDEYGAFGFNFDNVGCSTHFIISAIIVQEEDLETLYEQAENIRSTYFQRGEMKSSKVGRNHKRRLNLLKDLKELPFNIFLFVCDKRDLYEQSGLRRFKQSFYKFLNNFVYNELRLAFSNLIITADESGGNDFLISFKKYVESKNEVPVSLFDGSRICFMDSTHDVGVQIADIISGSLAYSFDARQSAFADGVNYYKLLYDKILRIEFFPRKFETFNVEQRTGNPEYNEEIANTCFRYAKQFIIKHKQSKDEGVLEQIAVLKYLLFRFMNNSPRTYIPTKELINHLVSLGYEKLSIQLFRMKIIAKLRDADVIISSSSSGYKIPSTEQELYDFVNHGKGIILPMLSRLKKCNDIIRMGTNNKIKLFEKAEYHSLGRLLKDDN